MLKKITLTLAALCCWYSAVVTADVLQLRENAPATYVVKPGDTLWDISGLFLNQPWRWPELWQMNPQVDNPHLIFPGDILTLTFDSEGRPQLTLNGKRAIRLSPQGRTLHKNPDAIATLPLGIIRPFLTYDQALTEAEIDALPYILGSDTPSKSATENSILYVKGELVEGAAYAVYRPGRAYIDPESNEILGYETRLVATARAFRAGQAASSNNQPVPAALNILSITREIRQGDRVIPAYDQQALPAQFIMQKPQQPIQARIIASSSELREFARNDVVVINRGNNELKPGHMLGIYRQSPAVVDVDKKPVYLEDASRLQKVRRNFGGTVIEMPLEKVGELMVFKVAENVSFALITQTDRPIRVGDTISNF